jgi:hypothetical protein
MYACHYPLHAVTVPGVEASVLVLVTGGAGEAQGLDHQAEAGAPECSTWLLLHGLTLCIARIPQGLARVYNHLESPGVQSKIADDERKVRT